NLGFIEKIPSKGVSIHLNPKKINEFHHFIGDQELIDSFKQLEDQVVLLLLQKTLDEYVTQNDLATQLFITTPTLRNTLDKVEDWFTNRHLEINRIRGKGVI